MSDTKIIQSSDLEDFTKEDLAQMITDKSAELTSVNETNAKLLIEKTQMSARALAVHEKNRMYEIGNTGEQLAEMEMFLKMAEKFTKSGAFPKFTPEQAYTVIQAGKEMNMKPVESLQSMYIVNGTVKFYGDKMVARILKHGYRLEYLNENPNGLTVRCFHPDPLVSFDVTEIVSKGDQILQRSKAMSFAAKNKMRFHGVRMIASFHLPHLFSSAADEFTEDFTDYKRDNPKVGIDAISDEKEKMRLIAAIAKTNSIEALEKLKPFVARHSVNEQYNAQFENLNKSKNG